MVYPLLTTHNLDIGYRRGRAHHKLVSDSLELTLLPGELVCLLGPNGAGKSTLIRTLAGMQPALDGRVQITGQSLESLTRRELARTISVVLTDRIDTGDMTMRQLVGLGRYAHTGWWGRFSARDEQAVADAIAAVGGEDLAERPISQLSDGERQKAMIARALAQDPVLLLLDEPTAHLDLPHRVEIMRTLRSLAHESGRAVLLTTHDLDLALRSADRVWLMSSDGGLSSGAPEDLILNGQFQDTFRREGVHFDPYTGSFELSKEQLGIVTVAGDGIPAVWTVRALERVGYCVTHTDEQNTAAHVRVISADSELRWRLTINDTLYEYTTIYDLLARLMTCRYAGSPADVFDVQDFPAIVS